MSAEENKAIARRLYEVFDQGDWAALDALVAPDAVIHDPVLGTGGPELLRQLGRLLEAGLTERQTTIHQLVAEGDSVVVLHTHVARHTGEFMGIPANRKQVTVEGLELFHIADSKIVAFWRHDDDAGLLQQLGMLPAPEQAGS